MSGPLRQQQQNLQFIMELLYWLSEGGDSEDREIWISGFETSCGLFNLDTKDLGQSSAQEEMKFFFWIHQIFDDASKETSTPFG
ncbi:hypothetical protein VULLAG_LOCUS23304 [Vulpes lagopus]|uniref:uncharacterized protein LOC111092789 isoform X1 n=1 Tax=Canis lupus familiaris TaxID=9615 RepID=UPI0015F1BD23|nr:uncharacterized protein LOC111092789 isoform X1 [Canis lupus familiaris]